MIGTGTVQLWLEGVRDRVRLKDVERKGWDVRVMGSLGFGFWFGLVGSGGLGFRVRVVGSGGLGPESGLGIREGLGGLGLGLGLWLVLGLGSWLWLVCVCWG